MAGSKNDQHRIILNDGFEVVAAEVPSSGGAQKAGNLKKFETLIIDPIDAGTGTTRKEILETLKPKARELLFHQEDRKQLIYDLDFFSSIETGDRFIQIWDIIVQNDNNIDKAEAVSFLKKFFSATSQIALKMEMLRQQEIEDGKQIDFNTRFEVQWEDQFRAKFHKKLGELQIQTQYNHLSKDFRDMPYCAENIIYHTRLHWENINFGITGLNLGKLPLN